MGGGAAGAIAAVELFGNKAPGTTQLVVTLFGALIGAVSLSGSLIAWAKLQGVIKKPLRVRGQQYFNILVLLGTLAVAGYLVYVAQGASSQLLADAAADLSVLRLRPGLRHSDDAADRRRGYAGGDLDLQRRHRPRGRSRRVRAGKPGIDDRRHGGRRRRHAADAADGTGHEPLGRKRPVHEFWRRAPSTSRATSKAA